MDAQELARLEQFMGIAIYGRVLLESKGDNPHVAPSSSAAIIISSRCHVLH